VEKWVQWLCNIQKVLGPCKSLGQEIGNPICTLIMAARTYPHGQIYKCVLPQIRNFNLHLLMCVPTLATTRPLPLFSHLYSAEFSLRYLRACDCRGHFEKIFDRTKGCIGPKNKAEDLDSLLLENLGSQKLSDACTNIIIPSFDIERQQPVFFSSWEVLSYYLSF
jgi:hypothetical protein